MNEARFIPEMHSRRMTDSGPKLRFRVTIRKSFNSEDNYKLHTGGTGCPEDLCPSQCSKPDGKAAPPRLPPT